MYSSSSVPYGMVASTLYCPDVTCDVEFPAFSLGVWSQVVGGLHEK